MISFTIVFLILIAHWFADFIKQTNEMARGKSKNWNILSQHIATYTFWISLVMFGPAIFIETARGTCLYFPFWVLLNGLCHFVVDAITSRITSQLHSEGEIHKFFCVIGFDQLIHTSFLIGTWIWLMT